jgi:hypothetical protein
VAGAGDVNGDGRADVIIGAYLAGNNSRTDSGSAYVVHGLASGAGVTPGALDFGGRATDAAADVRSVTVKSTGEGFLRPGTVSLSGSGDFAIASNSCTGALLASGASCVIGVAFDPSSAGAKAGELTITVNTVGSPLKVALSGSGIAPPPPAVPTPPVVQPPPAAAPFACTLPRRPKALSLPATASRLRINQRIAVAAIRRLNAINARLAGKPVPRASTKRPKPIRPTTTQLRINQRISEAAYRRARILYVGLGGQGASAPTRRARSLVFNRRGVGFNQLTNIRTLDLLNCINRNL